MFYVGVTQILHQTTEINTDVPSPFPFPLPAFSFLLKSFLPVLGLYCVFLNDQEMAAL